MLWSFSRSLATEWIPLHVEPRLAWPSLINLNTDEFHYNPFMVSLNRCNGSWNTLGEPYGRICILSKTRCKFK